MYCGNSANLNGAGFVAARLFKAFKVAAITLGSLSHNVVLKCRSISTPASAPLLSGSMREKWCRAITAFFLTHSLGCDRRSITKGSTTGQGTNNSQDVHVSINIPCRISQSHTNSHSRDVVTKGIPKASTDKVQRRDTQQRLYLQECWQPNKVIPVPVLPDLDLLSLLHIRMLCSTAGYTRYAKNHKSILYSQLHAAALK